MTTFTYTAANGEHSKIIRGKAVFLSPTEFRVTGEHNVRIVSVPLIPTDDYTLYPDFEYDCFNRLPNGVVMSGTMDMRSIGCEITGACTVWLSVDKCDSHPDVDVYTSETEIVMCFDDHTITIELL